MRVRTALLVCLACTGCPCDPGVPEVFYDGFERGCGEMPCGWTVEDGTAERVSTIHAGEHGVRLEGRISRDIDVELSQSTEGVDLAFLMVWCDAGAGLEIRVEIDEAGTPGVLTGTIDAGTVPEDGIMETMEVHLGARLPPYPLVTATRISIEVTGSGGCTVDELRILSGHDLQCMG
jgi:hypothetical protein